MAKKTSLKDKLRATRPNTPKIEGEELLKKKPLEKKAKNIENIEQQVSKLHGEVKQAITKIAKEPSVRLTVDVPKSVHKRIKIKTAELETKIQRYVLALIMKDLDKK